MKRLLSIIVIICCIGADAQNADWMSLLPNEMPACRVSIPGTHDSGTSGVRFPARHYAQTQTMTIKEQWNAGIRFFDLRPKPVDGRLGIYHGPADCHLAFADALQMLVEMLQQHPEEFCIVMTNLAGGGHEAMRMVDEEIRMTVPVNMLAAFESDLKVKDLRGKILFIHRNGKAAGAYKTGIGIYGELHASDSNERAQLLWQDYFCGGDDYLEQKWRQIETMLDSFNSPGNDAWCISHASGYTGSGITTNIKRNSDSTNAKLLERLQRHQSRTGIIPMDFPDQELIDAIIACN